MSSQSNPQPRNVGTTSFGSVGSFFVLVAFVVVVLGGLAVRLLSQPRHA